MYGLSFEVSAITNITPEHLDYHKSFEQYRQAKTSFLNEAETAVADKDEKDQVKS